MNGTLSVDRPEQVITRAGADEGFKAALLANPKAALRSLGLEVPEGVTLRVFENTGKVLNLVLPEAPDLGLVWEELDQAAGAARRGDCGHVGGACWTCACLCSWRFPVDGIRAPLLIQSFALIMQSAGVRPERGADPTRNAEFKRFGTLSAGKKERFRPARQR